tara:strand:- start:98 stop:385 length:288 start_codon:yes stop_codon:yes gene_type:complete
MKVVIYTKYGAFQIPAEIHEEIGCECGTEIDDVYHCYGLDIDRHDARLVKAVEARADADGDFHNLRVVTIPDDVEYRIEEYDGMEWIAEKHRTWA